jgi:predicted RNase H-like HicB family nuclease
MKAKYLVIIEKGERNYSAFSPDVPGCIATGRSVEATIDEMRSALEFHLEGIVESGESVPTAKGLDFYIHNTKEIAGEDILAHVIVDTPEMALA